MHFNWGVVFLLLCLRDCICQPMVQCSDQECVTYDFQTQDSCVDVTSAPPTNDCRWKAGLGSRVDELILGGRIAAYQIQWFNGVWSGWFVPGINDINSKVNTPPYWPFTCSIPAPKNSMTRVWAYFFDHTHRYILCGASSSVTPQSTPTPLTTPTSGCPLNAIVCDGGTLAISCPMGTRVMVTHANFGRTNTVLCPYTPASAMENANCIYDVTTATAAKCSGQNECSVLANSVLPVTNGVIHDPCVGTYKMLNVTYHC